MQYSVIDTAGRARRTVDIEVSGSPMMHDFSLTDEYVVIYDLPVTFDPVQVMPADVPRWLSAPARLVVQSLLGRVQLPGPMATAMNRNRQPLHRMPYRWNDAYPARLGVMPRDGGNDEVRWFDIEPCYVYHPLNAYSEMRDGAKVLVLDVVRYSRMFDRDLRGPGDTRPTLDRWTVNLATGAVGSELRDDRPQEFPGSTRPCWAGGTASATPSAPTAATCPTAPRRCPPACTSTTTPPARAGSRR